MPSDAAGARVIRLLRWNVHSWHDDAGHPNVDAVAELIGGIRPHVVSLVEIDEGWSEPDRLGAVARRCGYTSVFCPAFEYGEARSRGGFGNARDQALRALRQFIAGIDGKWIIAGDLNTPAASWITAADGWTVAPGRAFPTYPADRPAEAIDYYVAVPHVSGEAVVLPARGSDHLPVTATFSLPVG